MVLLIERAKLDITRLANAIRDTFQRRNTHEMPATLAPPPASWFALFAEMAAECGLDPNAEKHFGVVAEFLSKLKL